MKKRTGLVYIFSAIIAILATISAWFGFTDPGVYAGNSNYLWLQIMSQDLVTLTLVVPLLLIALYYSFRGSRRGFLIWVGLLGYLTYSYAIALFGIAYNSLFFLYVLVFSLSLFCLITNLSSVDFDKLSLRYSPATPVRFYAFVLLAYCFSIGFQSLAKLFPAVLANQPPELLLLTNTTTLVTQGLDLAILLPLMVITAFWLWSRQPRGYFSAGILFLVSVTIGIVKVTSYWLEIVRVKPVFSKEMLYFGIVTLIVFICMISFLSNLREESFQNHHTRLTTSD